MTINELNALQYWNLYQRSLSTQPGIDGQQSFYDYLLNAIGGLGQRDGELELSPAAGITSTTMPDTQLDPLKQPATPVAQTTTTQTINWVDLRKIVMRIAADLKDLLKQISASNDVEQRRALGRQFQEAVVAALVQAGYSAGVTDSADKIQVNGTTIDILRRLNTAGAETRVQLHVIDLAATSLQDGGTLEELINLAASQRQDLIDRINKAATLGERRDAGAELTSSIVAYLNQMGYSAQTTDSADKIIVNGQTYDIIRALNSLGTPIRFQLRLVE